MFGGVFKGIGCPWTDLSDRVKITALLNMGSILLASFLLSMSHNSKHPSHSLVQFGFKYSSKFKTRKWLVSGWILKSTCKIYLITMIIVLNQ